MLCRECKGPSRSEGHKAIVPEDLCFTCWCWLGAIDKANTPESVRVDGIHYWIGREDEKGSRGFAGRRFIILFKDGRRMETTNLWAQGMIPKRFRSRLPNNANFMEIVVTFERNNIGKLVLTAAKLRKEE